MLFLKTLQKCLGGSLLTKAPCKCGKKTEDLSWNSKQNCLHAIIKVIQLFLSVMGCSLLKRRYALDIPYIFA